MDELRLSTTTKRWWMALSQGVPYSMYGLVIHAYIIRQCQTGSLLIYVRRCIWVEFYDYEEVTPLGSFILSGGHYWPSGSVQDT
jgi:hypothetical protein